MKPIALVAAVCLCCVVVCTVFEPVRIVVTKVAMLPYVPPVAAEGEIIRVTPDGGKTWIRLRRTERPDRFQFVP